MLLRRTAFPNPIQMLVCLAILLAACVLSAHALAASPQHTTGQLVKREILSLYMMPEDEGFRFTKSHQRAETILNHLGLTVHHHSLRTPLPTDAEMKPVRGILLWLEQSAIPDPKALIDWAIKQVRAGKKLVLMGDWGYGRNLQGEKTPISEINRLFGSLGLYTDGKWVQYTYKYAMSTQDEAYVPFEASPPKPLPSFYSVRATSPDTHILQGLTSDKDQTTNVIAALNPNGGYIALGYPLLQGKKESQLQWIINPFRFFRHAFDTDGVPKVDTTTVSGRRIYYSHIDGDGWNNLTVFKDEDGRQQLASEYIRREIIAPFPDMPVAVAPIAAELHPDWVGTEASRKVARELFKLPQVEVASHTYTHPFSWKFYEDYTPDKEKTFRKDYNNLYSQFRRTLALLSGARSTVNDTDHPTLDDVYEAPRPYMQKPFSLDMEITGAAKYIESLAPPGKKVKILQWSGDTSPFEEALAKTEAAGLANINGGDSRLDAEFPSVAWVAPVGVKLGQQIQVYSSNSNENTYTDLWTGRFYGFRYLSRTVNNTGSPVRLKPFNIYYHMYSGERRASLHALKENLQLARSQKLTPIEAWRFSRIGRGFFTANLIQIGDTQWRVEDRSGLNTIRFDHATFRAVDFRRSKGVIGQTHFQGSLYVALDESEKAPIVAIKTIRNSVHMPQATVPYLVDARWRVWDVRTQDKTGLTFQAQGYGNGEMTWRMPAAGQYHILARTPDGKTVYDERIQTDTEQQIYIPMNIQGFAPLSVTVRRAHD